MKRLFTAAAISVTLLAAGCSSDGTPAAQAVIPTSGSDTPTTGGDTPANDTSASFDSGLLSDGGFATAGGWTSGNGSVNIVVENGNSVNSVVIPDGSATPLMPFNRNFQQLLTITQGSSYTVKFKARSDRNRSIAVGIGLNEEPFSNDQKDVALTSEWQDFEVTLSASNFGGEQNRIFFDLAGEDGLVVIDDISLVEVSPVVVESDFDSGLLTNGDFANNTDNWIGNAANAIDDGTGNTVNFADVEAAGDAFNVNLSQVVAIEQGKTYTLTFKAKSDAGRTMLAGIGLNETPFTNTVQTVNLTSELTTYTLTLAATAFGSANSRVLFDMGAETGEVTIDDVSLVEAESVAVETFDSGLLANGNFANGSESWIGNAANAIDDGTGNTINFADVETAGNAFDVGLSQVVAIEQGKAYELSFRAKSDGERNILAGIGLNEPPFTSAIETVDLTTEWQTFTLNLSSAEFGAINSRVLFDMGAATGEVSIDNVSLKEVSLDVLFDGGLLSNGNFEDETNVSWLAGVENATPPSTIIDDNGNKIFSVNVENAGDAFAVNLSQKLAIEAGKTYQLNFKAMSDRDRTIAAGIGLSGAPFTNQVDQAIMLSTEWQDFERTFTANFDSDDSRVLFDMGADIGVVSIDNVSLVEVAASSAGGLPVVDFETGDTGSSFAWSVFENADNPALEVAANPDTSAINTSATAAKITARAGGASFAGAVTENLPLFTLDATNKVVKVMVYKSVISDVGIKFESGPADAKASTGEIKVANTVINQWEELTFDFSSVIGNAANTDITGLVIFPDFVEGRAADSVTYFDNITFGDGADDGTGGGEPTEPVEPDPVVPANIITANGGFESGNDGWIGNAANAVDDGTGNTVNFASVTAAGDAFSVNLSRVVTIEQGKTYTLIFRARSNIDRTMIAGIGLNEPPFTNTVQTVNLSTEWQAYVLTLNAAAFGTANSRVLFDMGAEIGEVFIDDVLLLEDELVVIETFDSGLLANGDFANGSESWIGNAANAIDDGTGNTINFADVATAGNAFDVGLSQVVTIEQGKAYELSFKAKSNGNRNILAGIGLNEPPFTAAIETVDLTSEWQTFTLNLSSAEFGGINSRVLFDMGAATGEVSIDNVSLKEVSMDVLFDDGLLSNGNFEDETNVSWLAGVENATPPSTIIDDNGNKIFSVNVENAADAFAVNLSQKLAIEAGKTYQLNFKAVSDRDRTIAAGIGLSGLPFTNQVDQAIMLSAEWQDFERTFTANFEAIDSRVLFDMGADIGVVSIDDVSLVEVAASSAGALPVVDFETGDTGSSFAWAVFENADNPALEVVTNPDTSALNTSAMAARITARAGGASFAGAVTDNLPLFTLDATNKVVKMMVYKSVISDVGIKFESGPVGAKASTGEVKVANTVINQWEELTFDFSSAIGNPANTDITGFVVFPDFVDGRAADSITYFDNITFGE